MNTALLRTRVDERDRTEREERADEAMLHAMWLDYWRRPKAKALDAREAGKAAIVIEDGQVRND